METMRERWTPVVLLVCVHLWALVSNETHMCVLFTTLGGVFLREVRKHQTESSTVVQGFHSLVVKDLFERGNSLL